jgi:hypothetical protein
MFVCGQNNTNSCCRLPVISSNSIKNRRFKFKFNISSVFGITVNMLESRWILKTIKVNFLLILIMIWWLPISLKASNSSLEWIRFQSYFSAILSLNIWWHYWPKYFDFNLFRQYLLVITSTDNILPLYCTQKKKKWII